MMFICYLAEFNCLRVLFLEKIRGIRPHLQASDVFIHFRLLSSCKTDVYPVFSITVMLLDLYLKVHTALWWADLRQRDSLKDNIKMNLQEAGWGGMEWIDMVRDRVRWRVFASAAKNLLVP